MDLSSSKARPHNDVADLLTVETGLKQIFFVSSLNFGLQLTFTRQMLLKVFGLWAFAKQIVGANYGLLHIEGYTCTSTEENHYFKHSRRRPSF